MSDEKEDKKIIPDSLKEEDFRIGPFKIMNELGHGTFSFVSLGIHEQLKEKVAIKQMKKSELNNEKSLNSEINIQKNLFHPYLCQMYCVIEHEEYVFLINELCSGKDILQNIIDTSSPFSEEKACRIFQQIICGLDYLHKNFICHRDVKPENILITNQDDKNINIKIIDFGFSISFAGNIILKEPRGSPSYCAPEVLIKKEYKGNEADIWSAGIVLYVMVYGLLPFDQDNMKDLVYNIKNGIYSLPDTVSNECRDLLKKMIQINPDKRITIHEIKNHPWMKKFNVNLLETPGIFINEDILPVDIDIVKEMTGKNREKIHEVVDDIIKNRHNSNTVSYYLRVKKKIGRGEKSVSDISSDSELYLNYLQNEKSKIKYWHGDLDSRIKSLEEEIFESFGKEKEEAQPINKDDKEENKIHKENKNDINKNMSYQKIPIVLFTHNILLDIINKASEKAEKKEKALNSLKRKKIHITKFDEQIKNNSDFFDDYLDEHNNNNKYEDFMKKQLPLCINNNCLDNRNNGVYIKLDKNDNEESKQQIINRKKMIRKKLPSVDRHINTEKKKKIIFNNNFIKGEEDINISSSTRSNHNNILNCFSIQNFIPPLKNKDNNIDSSEDEISFKKHKKVKILLKDKNKIDQDPNEEVKEIEEINMDEINMDGIKKEEIINFKREISEYSFQTDSPSNKIEIVLKSILNDFIIKDKKLNEINYKCQKIDDKGETIIFNIKIVNENENSNTLIWKLESGDLNSFEELFYMIKNIFNLS